MGEFGFPPHWFTGDGVDHIHAVDDATENGVAGFAALGIEVAIICQVFWVW